MVGAAAARAQRGRGRTAGRPPLALPLCAAFLAVTLCGCGGKPSVRLSVRGGPSLDALFSDLAKAYEAQHPEITMVLNFSCPPCVLFREDQQASEMDLFTSIGRFEIDQLSKAGKLGLGYTVEAGRSSLCLATSERVKADVRSLADLHKPSVRRIGVGDPSSVAVGYYAKQALSKAGLWSELEPRLVYSQSGCELLKWLGLGRDIDAAIVFSVCEKRDGGTVQAVQEFAPDLIPPVPLIVGVSKSSQVPEAARGFADFVAGPQAREILAAYHVIPTDAHD